MRRTLYLAALCMAATTVFAPAAFGQTDSPITARGAQTAPLNADGTCPEGFVNVNAPFCAQESPNTPGRIFGYGEGDLAPETDNLRQTPDGLQYSDLPDVIPGSTVANEQYEFDPEADCSTQALINANPFGCFIPSPETVGSEFSAATTQDAVNRGLQTQAQACEQPEYLASIFAANCDGVTDSTPSEEPSTTGTTTTALPATGGPSLALLAGGLLVAAGLLLRRR